MCNDKCTGVFTLIISLLVGLGIAVLLFFDLIALIAVGQWSAVGIGLLGILITTAYVISISRQDKAFDCCVCKFGKQLIISSLALLILALVSLIFAIQGVFLTYFLAFIIGGLASFVIITIASLTLCSIGCCKR
ncbi:MAG: hypothetical protein U0L20_03980 [Ruminococcus sp.]|nr:hypothetical protein [Ruminococcus sp.]